MRISRKASRFLRFATGAILACGIASTAAGQAGRQDPNPCEIDSSWLVAPPEAAAIWNAPHSAQSAMSNGLTPVDFGSIVYDSNQGVCWLADANLAGHAEVRALVQLSSTNPDGSAPRINPDGTMDWETALNWVNALNAYNNGKGWLNHHNWQLPQNPAADLTCSAFNADNFGAQCTGSALGNLYNIGLAETYPNSVVPRFLDVVWPFFNLQPGLYWGADENSEGETTFSFNTGIIGANTTKYNLLHVLPMNRSVLGPVPSGKGVLPYLIGPAAGRAVYDTFTGLSWTLNANLPAFDNFKVTGTASITADQNGHTNGGTVTVPLVDQDGAVYLAVKVLPTTCVNGGSTTGLTSQWILNMNQRQYAGSGDWELPCLADLQKLYQDIAITAGDTRLEWPFSVSPFWRLQPGFYWACSRAANTGSNGPCDYTLPAPANLEWSFNFDDGFEGTDLPSKQFYVMVYFPAP